MEDHDGGTAAAEALVRAEMAALGVVSESMPCDPDLADTAAFCEAYGIAPQDSANTILVASKNDPPTLVACVVLATTRLDVNQVVRRRMGVGKASFADAALTASVTGMMIGGVTAFGLPSELAIWVDAAVMRRPRIVLGGGSRALKILVDPVELLKRPGVEVVAGLASSQPS